jgi:phage baseplate assembly protein W
MTVLTLPLQQAGDGGMRTVPVDSPAELEQAVLLLLETRPGERRAVKRYGTPDPRFGGLDRAAVLAAVEEWEPRADPLTLEVTVDGASQYVLVRLGDSDADLANAGG